MPVTYKSQEPTWQSGCILVPALREANLPAASLEAYLELPIGVGELRDGLLGHGAIEQGLACVHIRNVIFVVHFYGSDSRLRYDITLAKIRDQLPGPSTISAESLR